MGGITKTTFQPGNQVAKGHGRKGYEYESKQYKKMLKLTDLYLKLMESMLKGKPTTEERIRFEDVRSAMGKIIDKLHASKGESIELGDRTLPIPIININLIRKDINVISQNEDEGTNKEIQ